MSKLCWIVNIELWNRGEGEENSSGAALIELLQIRNPSCFKMRKIGKTKVLLSKGEDV